MKTAPLKIGTLGTLDGKTWLSWNDAKRQIRTMIRKSGHKALGTFRPRKKMVKNCRSRPLPVLLPLDAGSALPWSLQPLDN
jgi:hypothetical protein